MTKTSDVVTWVPLGIILGLAIAAVGGGFVWLKSDITGFRSDFNTQITTLTTQVSGVREGVAVTNQKLDDLIRETQRNGGRH
jgi:ABC-type transporter Mla subunit MlaD